MPRLLVTIGPNRFETEIAHVNDATQPTEINTDKFIGRVLVRIKDFEGVPPSDGKAVRDSTYFDGRTRKFSILIEGRFKAREGVAAYSGEEIQFGSDFDHIFTTFPRGPFNTGMRIAQWIDPATKYEETPPSGRPFIMSPYLACMNSVAAYPAPSSFSKALLLAHHGHEDSTDGADEEEDMVPISANGKEKQYWRFVGLKGNAPVDAFLAKYQHLLPSPASSRPSSPSVTSAPTPHPPLLLRRLGSTIGFDEPPSNAEKTAADEGNGIWGVAIPLQLENDSPASTPPVGSSNGPAELKIKEKKPSRFSLATLKSALDRHQDDGLHAGDLISADNLKRKSWGGDAADEGEVKPANIFDAELGVWRFGEEGVDVLEDTTFIFLDPSKPHTVAQRRKHFCSEGGKHRKTFTYDPEVVYATSFFSNFCDFNTFDVKMGPLNLNIASHFADQPVRYTLRSTRMAPRPDGSEGPQEEETFATISFELVDY